jgi:putative ATPase
MDLFSSQSLKSLPGTPLPEKMRPDRLDEVVGQSQALKTLKKFVTQKFLPNLIFWGPPGTGKTTVAMVLAKELQFELHALNATSAGVKDLRELSEICRRKRLENHQQSILFVDEIHRFNKGQQDVLLPFMERGDIVLVGATTENPSYELNHALLSRCRILVFERMDPPELELVLQRAARSLDKTLDQILSPLACQWLVHWSNGDTRKALSAFEALAMEWLSQEEPRPFQVEEMSDLLGALFLRHDKASDQHYDLTSAFIKSIRGSDADAGLYYLARLLHGGEDPVFIARRLVILASEDIGNADARGLPLAMACAQAVEMIGLPEARINLAQTVCFLASAPKSNSSYKAFQKAQEFVEKTGDLPIPLSLRSARTSAMKDLGYGDGYKYPHDYPKNFTEQNYWPEKIKTTPVFYEPTENGLEKQIKEYQNWLRQKTR